jgi:hypothetical protein
MNHPKNQIAYKYIEKQCLACRKQNFAPSVRNPYVFVPCAHCECDLDTGETLQAWSKKCQPHSIHAASSNQGPSNSQDASNSQAASSTAVSLGRKHDSGKTQYHLMPVTALEQINRVLMHGAKKYGDGNWRNVENAQQRYYNAAMRHMQAWLDNEDTDPESGLPHLAHAACSLLFMIEKTAKE